MPTTKTHLRSWFNLGLDLLLPPRCPMTGELVGRQGAIDPHYWAKLNFIQSPFCPRCGTPFAQAALADLVCGACLEEPPLYARARAAFRYDDASAGMILKFKHADGTQLTPMLAEFMLRAAADILPHADLLVPVPLHRWRLLKRRYNQSALLAEQLSRKTGIPAVQHVLRRHRFTPPQGRTTRNERLENIHNAFAVSLKDQHMLQDKNIILIDDVTTSGATMNECVKVLLKNGARSVDVLAVAKAVKE